MLASSKPTVIVCTSARDASIHTEGARPYSTDVATAANVGTLNARDRAVNRETLTAPHSAEYRDVPNAGWMPNGRRTVVKIEPVKE
jgi:hypothetical protein